MMPQQVKALLRCQKQQLLSQQQERVQSLLVIAQRSRSRPTLQMQTLQRQMQLLQLPLAPDSAAAAAVALGTCGKARMSK
jgi:hypothetical protein